jgi:large subunit ribosomal protein L24
MFIKKGDKVKILAGKDKGKTGKVMQVFNVENRVSVEGINISIKHLRPRRKGEAGQRVEFPAPIHASNLMFACPKCGRASRIGAKTAKMADGKEKKMRACKSCGEIID